MNLEVEKIAIRIAMKAIECVEQKNKVIEELKSQITLLQNQVNDLKDHSLLKVN